MTRRTRRKIDAALKAKIALEALWEQATAIWPSAIRFIRTRSMRGRSSSWIRLRAPFESGSGDAWVDRERKVEKLHATIGQLIIERDFVAKRSGR